MYNCYLHGWSNHYSACPACQGQYSTSSGTEITLNNENEIDKYINAARASYKLAEMYEQECQKLRAENERFAERYRLIELANKEWTRNDAVTFGKLLEENLLMREALAEAYDNGDGCVECSAAAIAKECLAKLSKKESDG